MLFDVVVVFLGGGGGGGRGYPVHEKFALVKVSVVTNYFRLYFYLLQLVDQPQLITYSLYHSEA